MEDKSPRVAFDLIKSLVATPDQSPILTLQRLMHCPMDISPLCYPAFDAYQDSSPQKILLPANSIEDQPVFVNPKQYHRILKRRVARSKQKPVHRGAYLHESRHRHACKRRRDGKGMFISKQPDSFSQAADRIRPQE